LGSSDVRATGRLELATKSKEKAASSDHGAELDTGVTEEKAYFGATSGRRRTLEQSLILRAVGVFCTSIEDTSELRILLWKR
jgi:hypothetical protein